MADFNPDAYLKTKTAAAPAGGFNPDAYLKSKAPDPSTLEAIGRGGAQGLSLGFGDEITGISKAVANYLKNGPRESVFEPGFIDTYAAGRDENRAANERAREAHPGAYGTSQFVGAVAPAIAATVASKGAAAPVALRALAPTTARGMATLAATEGLGHSEADLTKGEFSDAARDAALSGLAGYGISKAVPYVGRTLKAGLDRTGEALRETADFSASKALGLTKGLRKKFKLGPEETRALGRRALDKGVITPTADAAEMKARADALRELGGSRIGKIEKGLDVAGERPFIPRAMADLASGSEKFMNVKAARPIMRQYKMAMDDLNNFQMNPTFEGLQRLKNVYGDLAFPKGVLAEQKTGLIDAYHAIKRELETSIDEGVKKLRQPRISNIYKEAKKDVGAAKVMQKGLEDRVASEEGNRLIKLTDFIVGGAVGIPGGIVPALGAVAAKRGVEKYGYQVAATSAHSLSKLIEQSPKIFGRYAPALQAAAARGPQHVATTHYLLQQQDPEYRKMATEIQGEGGE